MDESSFDPLTIRFISSNFKGIFKCYQKVDCSHKNIFPMVIYENILFISLIQKSIFSGREL